MSSNILSNSNEEDDSVPQLVFSSDVDIQTRISSALHQIVNNQRLNSNNEISRNSTNNSNLSIPFTFSPLINPNISPGFIPSDLLANPPISPIEALPQLNLSTNEVTNQSGPVPLTIITGWLGAGKTTLLSYLLKELGSQAKQIAIIQNESSALGVEDPELMKIKPQNGSSSSLDKQIFSDIIELSNGCVCCSVQNDFVLGLDALLKKKRFDYIILECSGLADPGPLANLVWIDSELESRLYLDGIISLVDAAHLQANINNNRPESKQVIHQIAYADRIILNKCDLVDERKIDQLKQQLKSVNSVAPIACSVHSKVNLSEILNIHAFEAPDTHKTITSMQNSHSLHDSHACSGENCADHSSIPVESHPHDLTIGNLVFDCADSSRFVDLERLKAWLAELLWANLYSDAPMNIRSENNSNIVETPDKSGGYLQKIDTNSGRENEIFRLKAILSVKNDRHAYFLQAVQELFDITRGGTWDQPNNSKINTDNAVLHTVQPSFIASGGTLGLPHTKLVIIGRKLNERKLRQSFDAIFVS
jgi:G3E family GTPase